MLRRYGVEHGGLLLVDIAGMLFCTIGVHGKKTEETKDCALVAVVGGGVSNVTWYCFERGASCWDALQCRISSLCILVKSYLN